MLHRPITLDSPTFLTPLNLPAGPIFPLGELGGRLGRQISRDGKNTEKWKNMKDKSAHYYYLKLGFLLPKAKFFKNSCRARAKFSELSWSFHKFRLGRKKFLTNFA